MARYLLAVNSNPVPGREDEYNDWYSKRHIPDLLAVPGVVSARRFELSPTQVAPGTKPFEYLALYEIEADDPQPFIDELMARAGTERMYVSTAMSEVVSPVMWKEIQLA